MKILNMLYIHRIYDELYNLRSLVNVGKSADLTELEDMDWKNYFYIIERSLSMVEHELNLLEANENKLSSELKEPIEEE